MAYPKEFRRAVAAAYDACGSSLQVAAQFHCSPAWVRRLIQRRRELHTLDPLPPRAIAKKISHMDLRECE